DLTCKNDGGNVRRFVTERGTVPPGSINTYPALDRALSRWWDLRVSLMTFSDGVAENIGPSLLPERSAWRAKKAFHPLSLVTRDSCWRNLSWGLGVLAAKARQRSFLIAPR